MKRIDIEKQASEIVMAYMNKGYHLTDSPNYWSEDVRWDVTNRKDRIEIVICKKDIGDEHMGCSLAVYKSGDLGGESRDKRELIEEYDYHYIGGDWYGTQEDAERAELVRIRKRDMERDISFRNYWAKKDKEEFFESDAAKKMILPYIRENCYRCKSVKTSDIKCIQRTTRYGRPGFEVYVKEDWKFLPFKKW